jgi:hypothetical protein
MRSEDDWVDEEHLTAPALDIEQLTRDVIAIIGQDRVYGDREAVLQENDKYDEMNDKF